MLIRNTLILLCLAINACATSSPESRRQHADKLAMEQQWQRLHIPTQTFELAAYIPTHATTADTLAIYIEGDGLAWLNRHRLSPDPTPKNPLALQLALRHPTGNVAYLARPCQYVTAAQARNCSSKYWSSHRYAPEVINASNAAITALKARLRAEKLILVGYSGGGAVAALVAARRDDVVQLITVAGNLDHRAWTHRHGITPLSASLNPADAWQTLVDIPQMHFVGAEDKIIDRTVSHSYQRRFPSDKQPRVRLIENFDHHCCWPERWGELFPAR